MLGFRAVGFAGGVLSTLHFLGGCRRSGQMFTQAKLSLDLLVCA